MLKIKKIISNPIFIVVVFIAGITIGAVDSWYGLKFKTTIEFDLFDVFSLCVTVALAIYVARIIESDIQRRQASTEIWVKRFEQIDKMLQKLSDVVSKQDVDYNTIVNITHNIRIKLNQTQKALKQYDMQIHSDKDFDRLLAYFKKLKDKLTNTPIDKKDKSSIELNDGIVLYSSQRMKEINNLICQVENGLFLVKLRLASY